MPKQPYKQGRRKELPLGRGPSSAELLPAGDEPRMRGEGERRSKGREDDRRLLGKGKAPARQDARPSKKQKMVVVDSEDDEDVQPEAELGDDNDSLNKQSWR